MIKVKDLRLHKAEKLCARTAVSRLFEQGDSRIAYPLRAVYRVVDPGQAPARFLITVPKKKVRRAVDRVLLRRRIREAYRLCRGELLHRPLLDAGRAMDVAFIYLDTAIVAYPLIESRMRQLLARIAAEAAQQPSPPES